MDIETLIALAIIIGGGLISAFKKEKPVNQPKRPAARPQQPQQPVHEVEPQPVKPRTAQPRPVQKSESLENALEELANMFGGAPAPNVVVTPPPVPEVKKRPEMFIPPHEVPSVAPKKKSVRKRMPKAHADVPEFAKIHDIFKDGEIGNEAAFEQQQGPQIFSGVDDLKKAVIASEILNRKY